MNETGKWTSRTRRAALKAGVAGIAAAALSGIGAVPAALAQGLPMPKSPVTINIVDVAGNLALTQDAMEAYQKKNPNLVAKFNFTKAPSREPDLSWRGVPDVSSDTRRSPPASARGRRPDR